MGYYGIVFLCSSQFLVKFLKIKQTKKQKFKKNNNNNYKKKKNEKAAVIHRLVKFVHDEHAYLKEGTSYNSSWIHENMANENTAI